jgi:hypothetical protein
VLVLSISKLTTSFHRKSPKWFDVGEHDDNFISDHDLRPYYPKPQDDAPAVGQYSTTSMPMQLEGASTPLPDAEDPTDEPVTEVPAHLGAPADPSAVTDVQSQSDVPISTAGKSLQTDPPANDVPVCTISYGN